MSSGREQQVARRYAKALFDVSTPDDLDKIEAQLKDLAKVWESSQDFRESMNNPRVSEDVRVSVVAAVADRVGGWVTEPLRKTVTMLVTLRKASVIPALAKAFAHYVSLYKKSLLIEVSLANPASDAELAELQKQLSSSLGGEVKMTVKTDPNLIGGLTVRFGDSLLDRSVAGTLRRVAAQLV